MSPENPPTHRDLARRLAVHVAGTTARETHLDPGDLADLRRISPDSPLPAAFWHVWARHLVDAGVATPERPWSLALRAMAVLAGLHQPTRPLGEALAHSKLSDMRFTRLLRAREDQVAHEVRSIAAWLKSHGESCDLSDIAMLLLRPDDENLRHHIARSYYANLDTKES